MSGNVPGSAYAAPPQLPEGSGSGKTIVILAHHAQCHHRFIDRRRAADASDRLEKPPGRQV